MQCPQRTKSLSSVRVLERGLQDVPGTRPELLCRFDSPWQDGIRVDLEHPCGAPNTPACGQAGDDAHDELDRSALAMKNRAEGLQKIAATGDTQQLPPGTAIGMAIGAEIAPADPALRGTCRVGAKVRRGVGLTMATPRGYDAGRRVAVGEGYCRAHRHRHAA